MCGIFCYIYHSNQNDDKWNLIKDNISKRGPDSLNLYCHVLNEQLIGKFAAGVLWMQGPEPKAQPCVDDDGNILLWNGDIFSGPLKNENESDTFTLLTHLKSSKKILETISLIEGPFSLIYYQKSTNLLYFGRDFIGRHSLLIKIVKNKFVMLTSTANNNIDNIIELPACGIFVIDCNNSDFELSCYPWYKSNQLFLTVLNNLNCSLNVKVKESILSSKLIENVEPIPEDLSHLQDISDITNIQKTMSELLKNPDIYERVVKLWKLLKKSIEIRIKLKPEYCKNCIKKYLEDKVNKKCSHAKTGILFSGGLDSTILAAIANEYVPDNESIDLINVAFEKKLNSIGEKNNKSNNVISIFDVPDRKTGRQALNELQKLFPLRTWNFIEINVSRKELEDCCKEIICHLIYPLKTVLDESLGCAVWFASRGVGLLSGCKPYESSCRILLVGMGADELFGGYTRHRTILRRHGWKALGEELNMELFRISERNLGRDDRVISNHGRQSRLPYLDENVIQYVKNLKPWERCYPTEQMPPGLGDKLLLRLLAFKIGLHETASFPKRAFQFGSKIANSKQNANDISNWLQ